MAFNPKNNEEKMLKVLNAWKTLAPAKRFGGMALEDFEVYVQNSLVPRTRLKELNDQVMQQMALREAEDAVTMSKILVVVAGIIADPTEGDNSALYEACGYVRKDNRKSGLTRKRVAAKAVKV
jgi:hypothetical protein